MNKLSIQLVAITLIFATGFGVGWLWRDVSPEPENRAETDTGRKTIRVKTRLRDTVPGKGVMSPESRASPAAKRDQPSPVPTAPTASKPSPPRTAQEVIGRLLTEVEVVDSSRQDALQILGRLQQLRDFGEEGSAAIRDFLRTHEEVLLTAAGGGIMGGRISQVSSVRTGLLETLYDMNDATAKEACLEVLQSTTSGFEALLAARNLEKYSPGSCRTEVLKAVSEILPNLATTPRDQSRPNSWLDMQMLDTIGYYQAREMLPQVEELVKKQPNFLHQWANTLLQFPAEDQLASINRLMVDANLHNQLLGNAYLLGQLDFQNNGMRQTMCGVFSREMNPTQRQQFIQMLGQAGFRRYVSPMMKPGARLAPEGFKPDKGRIEGALRALDDLTPLLDSPGLKQSAEQARRQLQEQLKRT